ncbi:hypothetical protein P9112_000549 [Eukaryota sp. TZLM1-RC]
MSSDSSSDSDHDFTEAPILAIKPKTQKPKRGIIYLGHIPHGFYEPQMKKFFSQYGEVLRVRVCRSKYTGASKGYAFIEFKDPDVAPIVAEAMDGYILSHRILRCSVVPPEKHHPKLFKGAPAKRHGPSRQELHAQKVNRTYTPEEKEKRRQKLRQKDAAREEKLAAAGINFEFAKY